MANNNVAEASIVLRVDSSKLNSDMRAAGNDVTQQTSNMSKQAQKEAKARQKEIEKEEKAIAKELERIEKEKIRKREQAKKEQEAYNNKVKGTGSEALGNIFGGSSVLGMTAKAGAIGLIAGAAVMAGKAFYNSQVQLDAFNRSLEASARITERWVETSQLRSRRIQDNIAEYSDVAGTWKGWDVLAQQAKDANTQLKESLILLRGAEREQAKWDSTENTSQTWGAWFGGKYEAEKAAAKQKTDTLRAQSTELRKFADEAQRLQDKLRDPFSNPEARQNLRQFITSQKDAVKDLYRTPEDKALEGLKRKFGFKDEDLWVAKWTADLQRALTATKELKDYVQELSYEVEDFGQVIKRTSDDAKIDELIKHGAYEDDINKLKDFIKLKKQLTQVDSQTYQPLTGLVKGSKEEVAAQGKRDFEAKQRAEQVKIQNLLRQQLEVLKKIERQTAIDNEEF